MKQYGIGPKICKSIKTIDSKEPLVNLAKYSKEIIIDIEPISRKAQKLKPGVCFVRKSVAQRLVKAQSYLPKGMHLKVFDSYRPLNAQKKWWKQIFNGVKAKNPKMSDKEAEMETDKWIANPKKIIPQHTTGGTLDLTIAKKNGKELDLGGPLNTINPTSITNAKVSSAGRKNRNMLIHAMSKAGFANYMREYWHWSYGDWGWASANKKKEAMYGSI